MGQNQEHKPGENNIERTPVTMYKVSYKCPLCRKGYMETQAGCVALSDPPQYPAKCNICGEKRMLNNIYPHLDHS